MQRLTVSLLFTVLPVMITTPAWSQTLTSGSSATVVDASALSSSGLVIAQGSNATLVSNDYSSPINIRDGASRRAYARHIGYAGDRVEVIDQTPGEDGYMWFFVRFISSNATGWVRGDFIVLDGEEYWN
jgi:hypothetical protein